MVKQYKSCFTILIFMQEEKHIHKETTEFKVQEEMETLLKKQYKSMLLNMSKEIIVNLSKEIVKEDD